LGFVGLRRIVPRSLLPIDKRLHIQFSLSDFATSS
jgi:hypothetical protein